VTITLHGLLRRDGLRLRLIGAVDDIRLDAPVLWVHSSDLPDPTPWLEPGQVLLTDGNYLLRPDADADAYVRRLRERGILALGFATGVLHDAIPTAVVSACAAHDLPLFEVDRRTAFIAIIRLVADDLARDRRERLEWSLAAQRGIARAALRPDGLSAILAELEQRLDCWVALFDASGERVPARRTRPVPAELAGPLADQVALMLRQGTRSAARVDLAVGSGTLQSLGAPGRLGGVLAVGAATPLDEAGAVLVTSAIAIASVALEQSGALEAARGRLRVGILELAVSHDVARARAIARDAGVPVPEGPLRAVAIGADDALAPMLEAELAAGRRGPVFVARPAQGPIVVLAEPSALADVLAIAARRDARAGVSREVGASGLDAAELGSALEEARSALRRTTADLGVVRFEDITAVGVLGLLEHADAIAVARAVLAPIAGDRELLAAIATWLRHNGAVDPAARELGIHRHSLGARIARVERTTGLDLGGFDGRAELWTALRLAEPDLVRPASAR
jgi:PucR family transcriptional regulator, purine catabolism regulatory protein